MPSIHSRVLAALCEHPLLSRRQLELYLGCSDGWARRGLARLGRLGYIQRYDAHQPGLYTHSLFAPTSAGMEEAARQIGRTPLDFTREKNLTSARLERLALLMERAFQLRTLLLWLSRPSASKDTSKGKVAHWKAVAWDVEVARFFSVKDKAFWIPFHAAALFARPPQGEEMETHWIPAVIEFDLGKIAVQAERTRFLHFIQAQDDHRFWSRENEFRFPILLLIAKDQFRMQDYYSLLRALALSRQLPMPRAYFTTFREMRTLKENPASPIWYTTVTSNRVPLLFDLDGNPGPPPDPVPWRKQPIATTGGKEQLAIVTLASKGLGKVDPIEDNRALAGLAFALLPLEKQLLDKIAAHPLLAHKELAMLVQATERRVRPALRRLKEFGLVEEQRERYLLAPGGEKFLAMTAGYGHAVRRYALARGWGQGLDTLLQHWEHTRAENDFFLHLAAIAQARQHKLHWLSELESRLYYEAGHRRHSFLPDGRGTYLTGTQRYEFALEIDRTRSSQAKISRKFTEYAACLDSAVLRREGIELLRLIFVTSSWERAELLRRVAVQVAGGFPLFITTFDRYRASGADAAIWLRGDQESDEPVAETPKVYCFECFGSVSEKRVAK